MAANLVGHVIAVDGHIGDIDGPSTVATANGLGQRNPLGARAMADDGSEWIYLGGVASTAAGDFVIFNCPVAASPYLTARLVSTPLVGSVAVAGAALVLGTWGWYQIYGLNAAANIATASSDGLPLFQSSTAGRATSTAAATKAIFGAFGVGNAVSNVGGVFLNYPFSLGTSTI